MIYTRPVAEQLSSDQMAPKNRGVHWAIKVWLIFHCLVVVSRTLPVPSDVDVKVATEAGFSPAKVAAQVKKTNFDTLRQREWLLPYYTESLGIWQYWDMFAPNPAQEDIWADAVVEFADGSTEVVDYPRMYEMGIAEKYVKERYRKYRERFTSDAYAWKWPHTAHWFAARAWKGEGNIPVRVTLRRHFYLVGKPPTPPDKTYETMEYYSCLVDQQVLRGLMR